LKTIFVSSFTNNEVANISLLRESLAQFHPDIDFKAYLIGNLDTTYSFDYESFTNLEIPNFESLTQTYSQNELKGIIQTFVVKKLLSQYDKVVFFEPNTLIYRPIDLFLEKLNQHPMVVLPQRLTENKHTPDEKFYLNIGLINSSCVGFRQTEQTLAFADWWASRTLRFGKYDIASGYGSAQLWLMHCFSLVPDVCVLREASYQISIGNVHERTGVQATLVSFRTHELDRQIPTQHIPSYFQELDDQYQKRVIKIQKQQKPTQDAAWGFDGHITFWQEKRFQFVKKLQKIVQAIEDFNPTFLDRKRI
jgi:hypothetical protein